MNSSWLFWTTSVIYSDTNKTKVLIELGTCIRFNVQHWIEYRESANVNKEPLADFAPTHIAHFILNGGASTILYGTFIVYYTVQCSAPLHLYLAFSDCSASSILHQFHTQYEFLIEHYKIGDCDTLIRQFCRQQTAINKLKLKGTVSRDFFYQLLLVP